jgi:hypothetical protein
MIPQIEGLYMIHTYACLSNKENIYKIGRSNNLYPLIVQRFLKSSFPVMRITVKT